MGGDVCPTAPAKYGVTPAAEAGGGDAADGAEVLRQIGRHHGSDENCNWRRVVGHLCGLMKETS
jgi:hypothetical protein